MVKTLILKIMNQKEQVYIDGIDDDSDDEDDDF